MQLLWLHIVFCDQTETSETQSGVDNCVKRMRIFLLDGTKVFQCNTFNRHIYITTILFSLNLVCKTVYYTFCIILTSQHIFVTCTTLKGISVCVAIVMNSIEFTVQNCLIHVLHNIDVTTHICNLHDN